MIDGNNLTEKDLFRAVVLEGVIERDRDIGFLVTWAGSSACLITWTHSSFSSSSGDNLKRLKFLVDNPIDYEDQLANQNRCIHCHRKWAGPERSRSVNDRRCIQCGGSILPMTRKVWVETYNQGKDPDPVESTEVAHLKSVILDLESQQKLVKPDNPMWEMLNEEIRNKKKILRKKQND